MGKFYYLKLVPRVKKNLTGKTQNVIILRFINTTVKKITTNGHFYFYLPYTKFGAICLNCFRLIGTGFTPGADRTGFERSFTPKHARIQNRFWSSLLPSQPSQKIQHMLIIYAYCIYA